METESGKLNQKEKNKFLKLAKSGDQDVLEAICAECLNIFLLGSDDYSERYDGSSLCIDLMNTTYRVFEKVTGRSFEETEVFWNSQRSDYLEVSMMNLSHIYTSAVTEPVFILFSELPLIKSIDEMLNGEYEDSLFKSNLKDIVTMVMKSDKNQSIASYCNDLDEFKHYGQINKEIVFRIK